MIPGDDSDMFETFLKPSSHLGLEKLGRNTGRWNVIDKSPRYILLVAVPVNVHKENHLFLVVTVFLCYKILSRDILRWEKNTWNSYNLHI